MKILYISYDGMTDPLGQSQVLPYLQGLSKHGYEITLLSCEKKERFEPYRQQIETICTSSNIKWRPIMYTRKPPVLSAIYDVRRLISISTRLHRENKFRIVHCRSYVAALVGLYMKNKSGTKFIFDMRGFWADERVEGGLWNLSNIIYKTVYNYFKKKEIRFLTKADYTVSLTQNAADEIHTWQNIPHQPIPIEIIPCCSDLSLFNKNNVSREETESLRTKLNIKHGQFVLSYVGSLGTWYLLSEMLDFFAVLLKQMPDAVFLFITNDPGQHILDLSRRKNITDDKIIITNSPRQSMPVYISLTSFNIFFIKPSFAKKASSPVKQGEVMGMGIPIICNSGIGDTDKIINESKAGIIINEFNEAAYTQAIAGIKTTQLQTENIIAGGQEYYSLEKGVQKYLHVYKTVAAK